MPIKTKIKTLILNSAILLTLFGFGYQRINKIENLPTEAIEKIPMTVMSSYRPFTASLTGRWDILEKHIEETKKANSPYLNIWPESMGFALLAHQPAWDKIRELTNDIPGPLLLTPSHPEEDKIYNTCLLLEPNSNNAQLYKKRFLTPVGEYVPSFIPKKFVYSQRHPGDQNGHLTMLVEDRAGTRPYRIGPIICLEETLSKATRQSLAQGAEIFISPSNHGDTLESCALQQERMAQIRAIETATPIVRVGNIGDSNVINFYGKETWRSTKNNHTMTNIHVEILKDRELIFPPIYLKLQDLFVWGLVCLALIGAMIYKK
jgi:apolipoprotein N-acyltransferase